MTLTKMEFNERLQSLRTSKNLTQEELAEKLFVSRTAHVECVALMSKAST